MTETYLTVNDVAKILHLHPERVRFKAARNEIPGTKLFGKWLFRESKIHALARGTN